MLFRHRAVWLLIVLLVLPALVYSQVPELAWSMSIPQYNTNYPADMEVAPNGDWVIAVNYEKGPEDDFRDSQIIGRFTANGSPVWVINPEVGEQKKNFTFDIAVSADGKTWVVGEMDVEDGWPYPFSMVIDANGTVLSTQIYPSTDNPVLKRVLPLSDGGAVIAGSRLNGDGLRVGFAARLNSTGGAIWMRNYGDSPEALLKDVIEFQGGLLFAGGQNMTQQYYDPYFVHTDMNGDVIWSQTQNVDLFMVHSMIELDDGVVTLNSVLGLMWMLWFDTNGQLTGVLQLDIYYAGRQFNSTPFVQMPDGGYAIGGIDNEGNGKILRTDATGATMWSHIYANPDPTIEQKISDLELMQNGAIQFSGVKIDNNDASWIVQLQPEGMRGAGASRVLNPFILPLSAGE